MTFSVSDVHMRRGLYAAVCCRGLTKKFTCEVCGVVLGAMQTYKTHMRRHSGELPYQCWVCQAAFPCKLRTCIYTYMYICELAASDSYFVFVWNTWGSNAFLAAWKCMSSAWRITVRSLRCARAHGAFDARQVFVVYSCVDSQCSINGSSKDSH